jgi:hypothetical protein
MTAPAKAAPMREDVTQEAYRGFQSAVAALRSWASGFTNADTLTTLMAAASDLENNRNEILGTFAHTARADAGDDKAEIERLRGLLIDPGTPPWEDARAVLEFELRKAGLHCHADNIGASHPIEIPSHIALNLIAQAARRPDAGDEVVERVRDALKYPGKYLDYPGNGHGDWQARAVVAALAAMREGVDRGMVERIEWVPGWLAQVLVDNDERYEALPRSIKRAQFSYVRAAALEQPR